jgi:hypothetical protein
MEKLFKVGNTAVIGLSTEDEDLNNFLDTYGNRIVITEIEEEDGEPTGNFWGIQLTHKVHCPFHLEFMDITNIDETNYDINEIVGQDFLDDLDKVYDLLTISKEEFLQSYSYMTEKEYDWTLAGIKPITDEVEGNEDQIDTLANLCRRAENLYIEELNGRPTSWNVLGSQLKEAIYDFVRNNYTEVQQDLFNDYCNDLAI